MQAISATPETIKTVFSKKYIIPDFQRPYSWERDECVKLWDDIINFYEERKGNKGQNDQYFLGSIVLSPEIDKSAEPWETSEAWEVIDGQQRLTTLLLLIKALHRHAGTYVELEECYRIKNAKTGDWTDKLRVVSNAMDDDRTLLEDILSHGEKDTQKKKPKILDNYTILGEEISKWWGNKKGNTEVLENLISVLLHKTVLLPICCDSEDDVLTLFEVINNRGKPLSDADIFKATLYRNTEESRQREFKEEWNALEEHDSLFRKLMHITRAKAGDTTKEIGLRSFFRKEHRLSKCDEVMNSLKTIHKIKDWRDDGEIDCLWGIMEKHPNKFWEYPLYVFLHKYGRIDSTSNDFVLPKKKVGQFKKLLETTVRYFFIKGVVYRSINAVKDTVFKVCSRVRKTALPL